jgi:hypothetical protein
MLLENRWSDYGQGALEVPGFLWRSDTLFEKAMLRLVRQCARAVGMSAEKRSYLVATGCIGGEKLAVHTTPDIGVYRGTKPITLLDSKYKLLHGVPSADDLYQVSSGGRVGEVKRAALIYPRDGLGLQVNTFTLLGDGFPLDVDVLSIGFQSFASFSTLVKLKHDLTRWLVESEKLATTM